MTYKSKADLRQTIEDLKVRATYHENRADHWSTQYWDQEEAHDEALDKIRDAHQYELERLRDSADRIVTGQQEKYRMLAEAVEAFYGVSPDEVIAAQATQQEIEGQKRLKDNLKKVKNANKTEEGK